MWEARLDNVCVEVLQHVSIATSLPLRGALMAALSCPTCLSGLITLADPNVVLFVSSASLLV